MQQQIGSAATLFSRVTVTCGLVKDPWPVWLRSVRCCPVCCLAVQLGTLCHDVRLCDVVCMACNMVQHKGCGLLLQQKPALGRLCRVQSLHSACNSQHTGTYHSHNQMHTHQQAVCGSCVCAKQAFCKNQLLMPTCIQARSTSLSTKD